MNTTAMQPQIGETAVVEFDWRVFTGEVANNSMMDICMVGSVRTNGVWEERTQVYADSADSAMGFRLYQKGSGGWRIYYYETSNEVTAVDFDDAVLGIDPANGDHTSDTVRVTYSIERTEKDGALFAGLNITNTVNGESVNVEFLVDNAALYSQESFYAAFAGNNNYAVGMEGNEFDNLQGIIRAADPEDELPDGVIIDEDFDDFADGTLLNDDREWEPLNKGDHFAISNGVASCWPSEGLGVVWRGEMNTFSSIGAVEPGETIEISFDEKIYGRDALNSTMLDVMLSSVYTNAATSYDNENAIGIRISKKATGDYQIETYADSPGADDFFASLSDLGDVAADGTTTSEWHRVTYTLEKSETADTWLVDVTVSNLVSGWSDSLTGVDVVQPSTYNAEELFFGFYGASNYGNTNGISVDNLLVKHIVPPLYGYDLWADTYGVTDPEGHNDADGISNWGEWVLDGDPNDSSDVGVVPVMSGSDYVFSIRNDSTVGYALITTEDLVMGPWTTGEVTVVTLNDFEMSEITNTVSDSGTGRIFVKLYLEKQ
ncbi:hypothetical protein EGM51_07460 [Verrucomicrobia bacterium S94]|nr:hypothetical protein EGM51_07460 [Verrucomicrobia bacterium S94]